MLSARSLAVLSTLGLTVLTASGAAPATPAKTAHRAGARPAVKTAPAPPTRPMTDEEAHTAVALLDDAYQTILHEVHRTYPTRPGRPVAATIVRDLQKVMTAKGWPASHFLAVNAIIMNPDHRAHDAFERNAVNVLAKSDGPLEKVSNGTLRVATVVPLGGDCFSCHWADSGISSRAAISWTIPLKK